MTGPTALAKVRAKRLRRNPTYAESAFWELVRDRRLDGLKFRRQAPFNRFVVDFVCHETKLVVEIDGGVHRMRAAEDEERDTVIEAEGYSVLRFDNEQVLARPHEVEAAIRDHAGLPQSPLIRR